MKRNIKKRVKKVVLHKKAISTQMLVILALALTGIIFFGIFISKMVTFFRGMIGT